jgi:hypothetical protein
MIAMNFIKYLTFKYKLTSHKPKQSKKELITDVIGLLFLFLALTAVLYFIINALSQGIQGNMNKYILALFAFLCLISLSASVKKFYKEYFLSAEREILLVAPIRHSQIILARFSIVAIEILSINTIFLLPFILANYAAGNIPFAIILVTIPQLIAGSIFFSALSHMLFALAFIISRGKGLKTVAYSIMTLASVGVIAVIVYTGNYKQYLLDQNEWIEKIFYVLLQYPVLLMENPSGVTHFAAFSLAVIINAAFYILPVYFIMSFCYKKGMLTVSSKDLEKSFYSNKATVVIHKFIDNYFLKKDLLYLIRTPKLFSVYVSPLLFTSVIEFKNQFASSGITLTILINVFSLIITTVTLNIILSDDKEHQELLYSIPFNYHELLRVRSRLVHVISFLVSGAYLLIIMLLQKVDEAIILYGIGHLFILTYISSRVYLSRIMQRNLKKYSGYKYNGELVKPLFYYLFVWNIPILVLFTIFHVYILELLENQFLSVKAVTILIFIVVIIIGMIYKSNKTTIKQEVSKVWQT